MPLQSFEPTVRSPHKFGPSWLACGFAALTLTGLVGCSTDLGLRQASMSPVNWLTPYKVDVVQGNFVSKEQTSALRAGMTRAQVKELLGTPLVTSVFHADRWDYVFTIKRAGVQEQSFKYTVLFKGDALVKFEGDEMPTEVEFLSKIDNGRVIGSAAKLEASEEQLKAAERAPSNPANQTTPNGPPTTPVGAQTYPPLESPAR